jgi:hypothetical protein
MVKNRKVIVLAFALLLMTSVLRAQDVVIKRTFDEQLNISTIQLPTTRIAYEQGKYHSLDFSLSCSFKGSSTADCKSVDLELVSVVKARRLNTDLYVVFVPDGKPVHFGSNRSAISNPVPGRLWIGERMVFKIPREDFLKLASAKKLAIRFGETTFELAEKNLDLLRQFASKLQGRPSVGALS